MPLALRNAIHRHTPGFYDHFYYYYLFIHLAWIFLLAMLTNLYMLLLLCTSNPSNFHICSHLWFVSSSWTQQTFNISVTPSFKNILLTKWTGKRLNLHGQETISLQSYKSGNLAVIAGNDITITKQFKTFQNYFKYYNTHFSQSLERYIKYERERERNT